MDEVIALQADKLAIPRRYGSDMKEMWALQPRFLQRSGRRPYRALEHPRFRAGYDFLLLRCASGEVDASLCEWWTHFQQADDNERKEMLLRDTEPGRKKRRRRRRRPSPESVPAQGGDA
jgi:poly(A) polymerase